MKEDVQRRGIELRAYLLRNMRKPTKHCPYWVFMGKWVDVLPPESKLVDSKL